MDITGLMEINDWFLLIVIIVASIYLYLTWSFNIWEKQGVVGPKPYPVLGTMWPFLKKGVYHDLDLYQKYGKIVGTFEGRTPALLVADPDFIRTILVKEFHVMGGHRSQDIGTFRDLNIFNARGDYWNFLRHTISPTFSTGKIKSMMGHLDECSRLLVENLEEQVKAGNEFDLRRHTGAYTMDVICRIAFGLNVNSQKEENIKFVVMMNKIFQGNNTPMNLMIAIFFLFPGLQSFFAKLGVKFIPTETENFFSDVTSQAIKIREEDASKHDDFLNIITTAHRGNKAERDANYEEALGMDFEKRPLTKDEIKAQAFLFFAAGYDTTANALCWLIYNLAWNLEIQEKVYDEIKNITGENEEIDYEKLHQLPYLDMCIQETLRIYPSVARLDRVVSQDTTVNGIHLPKGCLIVMSIFAMHRLPDVFPEPDMFRPERFLEKRAGYLDSYYYMPFGGGPRACIGMRLALLEMKLAAVHLLRKFNFRTTAKTRISPNLGTALNLKEQNGTWLQAEFRCYTKEAFEFDARNK